jgi:hypothetical protein
MATLIPLTRAQSEVITEFYSVGLQPIFLAKKARDELWKSFKKHRTIPADLNLSEMCPALEAELIKALDSGKNVQSAVFSECVYAQALADVMKLDKFTNFHAGLDFLRPDIEALVDSYGMFVRYIYADSSGSRMLIQAGGHGGVDGALISVIDLNVYTIEFKEPYAKTSEPDLPPYGEDGFLVTTPKFKRENPQFASMLEEQLSKRLNFWQCIGHNVNDFSAKSLFQAVTDNYAGKKFADVICTEDSKGFLTMIPANQAPTWSDLEGEIRPAGRNKYAVWTPKTLEREILNVGGTVHGGNVFIPTASLTTAGPRGGQGISRYKINSVFFVRATDVIVDGSGASFPLNKVLQLRPTITAKMKFKDLDAGQVRDHYLSGA